LEELSKLFDKFSNIIFAKIIELWKILSGGTNFSCGISQIFHRAFLKCANLTHFQLELKSNVSTGKIMEIPMEISSGARA